jgi:hypothetical protein
MAHIRKQIRDRLETILTSGVSLVQSRVFGSRIYPLTAPQLPAIAVYTASESSNLQTMGLRTQMRDLSVSIDVYVMVNDKFDDDIDALCVQIEQAIAADYTLNGLAKDTILTGTEIDFDGEAEKPIGVARLTYRIRYVTSIEDVETAR